MNVKVRIEITDEFDNNIVGISETNNISKETLCSGTDEMLQYISEHIQRALIACGYEPDMVYEYVGYIDDNE